MRKNTAEWLTVIEPKVNLRPQLSLNGFSQVTRTVLEVRNKFVQAVEYSILLSGSSFSRTVDENVVAKEIKVMVALSFLIWVEKNLEQQEMMAKDNEQKKKMVS